jgi:hypothetical protein
MHPPGKQHNNVFHGFLAGPEERRNLDRYPICIAGAKYCSE